MLTNNEENGLGDKPREKCGVFGVFGVPNAARLAYFGLHTLQHRGQEGAGIAVSDGEGLHCTKGKGLVLEVFTQSDIDALKGSNSIGHIRYSTCGGDEWENIQPIVARANRGSLAVAHNGQIVNAQPLRDELENMGHLFHTSSDSAIILHLIQGGAGNLMEKLQSACARLEGAFAFLILTPKSLYAIRDRHGLRPLAIATLENGWCAASETCAFDAVGAKFLRNVEPGEIIKFSRTGMESRFYTQQTEHRLCAMEYVYFAREDSSIDGKNVHLARRRTGELLARTDCKTLKADLVVGVPDSSLPAAMGYSEASGIPYGMGLIKNRYVGRTFIEPTQEQRDLAVRMKLSANSSVVQGKRIVLIDDSIVRGTTSRRIIRLLREAGASQVHLRVASPPILYPCFYGVDISSRKELISAGMDPQALCRYLGADSLRFLSVEQLREAYGEAGYCFSCFTGDYLTPLYGHRAD